MSWTEVVAANPGWTFLIAVCAGSGLLTFLFRCWNRFMRMLNIRKHGWPPSHCDADGDLTEMYREQSKRQRERQ